MTTIPPIVSTYLDAMNRRDIETAVECFAADAMVRASGERYHGRAAIRAWKSRRKSSNATFELQSAGQAGGGLRVESLVSGDFPGSPIVVHQYYRIQRGLISVLELD